MASSSPTSPASTSSSVRRLSTNAATATAKTLSSSASTTKHTAYWVLAKLQRVLLVIIGFFLPWRVFLRLKKIVGADAGADAPKVNRVRTLVQLLPFALTLVAGIVISVIWLHNHYTKTCTTSRLPTVRLVPHIKSSILS